MYCIKCGVELSEGQKICPLCKTKVYHPDFDITEINTYPKKEFKSEAFNRKGLMFVITIIFLIPLLLPMILELSWQQTINWSGYVAGGVLLFYIAFMLPYWFKHPNPAIFVPSFFAATTLYLLYICLQSGGEWFLNFAMPITVSFGAIITTLCVLLHYLKRGKLYVIGGCIIALGAWTALIEFLTRHIFGVNTAFYWSSCTFTISFIIGMLLIIIEIVKPIKESLRKIFFIGRV